MPSLFLSGDTLQDAADRGCQIDSLRQSHEALQLQDTGAQDCRRQNSDISGSLRLLEQDVRR
jgi:hypothetical protein